MKIYKFSELFSYQSGKSIIPTSGTVPIYGSNGIVGFTDKSKYTNKIIIGRVGANCGSVLYCENDFNATDNTLIATCDETKILYKFAYYLLKQYGLNKFSGGSAQPLLTQGYLNPLKCEIHDIITQQKIVHILSRYDEAIENNNKRIKLLEQMAQNLYKEWFVRFRFPGYENCEFENGIPVGWKVCRVGEYVKIKSGFAFKSEWWQDEGCPVVKIKDITDGKVDTTGLNYVSEEHTQKAKSFLLQEGDLVIAMTGATIGKIGIVPKIEKLFTNQRVGKFFLGDEPFLRMPFLYCLFSQNSTLETVYCLSGASSAQPNISPEQLESIKFINTDDIVDKFNKKTAPIFKMILKLRENNQKLIKQRDLLLPRLMSGKIEV